MNNFSNQYFMEYHFKDFASRFSIEMHKALLTVFLNHHDPRKWIIPYLCLGGWRRGGGFCPFVALQILWGFKSSFSVWFGQRQGSLTGLDSKRNTTNVMVFQHQRCQQLCSRCSVPLPMILIHWVIKNTWNFVWKFKKTIEVNVWMWVL